MHINFKIYVPEFKEHILTKSKLSQVKLVAKARSSERKKKCALGPSLS